MIDNEFISALKKQRDVLKSLLLGWDSIPYAQWPTEVHAAFDKLQSITDQINDARRVSHEIR